MQPAVLAAAGHAVVEIFYAAAATTRATARYCARYPAAPRSRLRVVRRPLPFSVEGFSPPPTPTSSLLLHTATKPRRRRGPSSTLASPPRRARRSVAILRSGTRALGGGDAPAYAPRAARSPARPCPRTVLPPPRRPWMDAGRAPRLPTRPSPAVLRCRCGAAVLLRRRLASVPARAGAAQISSRGGFRRRSRGPHVHGKADARPSAPRPRARRRGGPPRNGDGGRKPTAAFPRAVCAPTPTLRGGTRSPKKRGRLHRPRSPIRDAVDADLALEGRADDGRACFADPRATSTSDRGRGSARARGVHEHAPSGPPSTATTARAVRPRRPAPPRSFPRTTRASRRRP